MTEYDVEDLYDLWVDRDLWPSGEFFSSISDLVELEAAVEKGDVALFKVSVDSSQTLYGFVVKNGTVHVDVFAEAGEELTPEAGAATLTALVSWAFENTASEDITKYLDPEAGPIHDQFELWGFERIEPEEEDVPAAASATPAPAEGEAGEAEEGEEGEEGEGADSEKDKWRFSLEEEAVEEIERTWVPYVLKKEAFSGNFAF
jgi:hypothetical protein